MAPIDRREHRQQRVRGAGPSSVQSSFGFDFGALGARPAKQTSLPPQPSSRRTPVRSTPRGANGSAQRHRSVSVQRSSGSKRKSTPKDQAVTPQLGKRKRGLPNAPPSVDNGEEDELSPDREEAVRSIEKSRRVVGAVSPIREEIDEAPDELSMLEDGGGTARKTIVEASAVLNGTPVSVLAQKRMFSGNTLSRTPIASTVSNVEVTSRQSLSRRSKSTQPDPATPSMQPNGRPKVSSAPRSSPQFDTPVVDPAADDSEDELSPPQANESTPRIVSTLEESDANQQEDAQMGVDELSSPIQPTPVQATPATRPQESKPEETAVTVQKKRGRPWRIVLDEEDEASSVSVPVKTTRRGRPPKATVAEDHIVASTPVAAKPAKKRDGANIDMDEDLDDQLDELSPDKERDAESARRPRKRDRDAMEVADGDDVVENDEPEPEPEEDQEPTPEPAAVRKSPKRPQHVNLISEKPQRKRHKFLGPKHAISVMRIKGSTVRGITVVDTTRTILEETIDHRLNRMAEKLQTAKDSAQRKELRSEINLSLSFKESLNEKLMDLQDANDVLSINSKKMKVFKHDNAQLRKDIITSQNDHQELLLEWDDVQGEYDVEKAIVDARTKLSEDMFEIEAAIQEGRKRAHKEGREDEGPQVPLSMLLGMVGRDVGSFGGGLLSNIKNFNGALERAAGWLEGRA
ncbi:hypothetical protein CC86DRAFT_356056 [Ophiobolus disseminans]|uniref:Uncharacterized protein n=1 Tax=Ophiobolus disseminans TaxID=1469910 RepID=A0A6A6ZQV1_9PLEO|nr:hypothetical protein CC86DRAFT_356056 [Ophiobolus disseminans]